MKPFPRVGSIVLVSWDDAYGHDGDGASGPGARFVDASEWPDRCGVETLGWVVRLTQRSVYIAQERAKVKRVKQWRGVTRIPRRWIERVVRIA